MSVDPAVYDLAERLAADLPDVLAPRARELWIQRLAESLQQTYEDWSAAAESALRDSGRE